MSRKSKYLIAYIAIMAAIIGYGITVCIGIKNMAPWTDHEFGVLIPLGILAGLGFFVSQELWAMHKEAKKKK